MSNKNGKYPEWQKAIREAQSEARAALAAQIAKSQADAAEKERKEEEQLAAGFKQVMAVLGLPEPESGMQLEKDGVIFRLSSYSRGVIKERIPGTPPTAGAIPTPQTVKETPYISFDLHIALRRPDDISEADCLSFARRDVYYGYDATQDWSHTTLGVKNLRLEANEKVLRSIQADIADKLDQLAQESPERAEQIRTWKKEETERKAKAEAEAAKPRPVERPLPPLPTLEEKLFGVIRAVVQEVLAEREY